ncbi:hypothetical protein P8452_00566 [Trifolium repens]|nr:hypothetical protein P8452_00566 [Trifolium repens]
MLRPQVHRIAFLKYCPLWAMFKPSWNNYYGNEKVKNTFLSNPHYETAFLMILQPLSVLDQNINHMCFDIACFSRNCGKLEDAYQRIQMLMSKLHLPPPYAPYNDTQMKGISSRKKFLFHENHNGACS